MKLLQHLKSLSATVSLAGLLALSPAYAADLIIGSSTEPSALDPHFSRTGNNQNIAAQIFDRLISPDPNLQVTPALAESWQNVDPTTWRIKLRSGVKWQTTSNFTPTRELTADDVIFSIMRQLDPNHPYHKVSGGTYEYFAGSGLPELIASAEKVDDLTVKVTLKEPNATFVPLMSQDFSSILDWWDKHKAILIRHMRDLNLMWDQRDPAPFTTGLP